MSSRVNNTDAGTIEIELINKDGVSKVEVDSTYDVA